MSESDKIAYYPGCSLHGLSRIYDRSSRLVCANIGITLVDIPDWNCCGATSAHSIDHDLNLALNARNLQLARKAGAEAVTAPCAACYANLTAAAQELRDDDARRLAGELLDESIRDIQVKHLLGVLSSPWNIDNIARQTVRRFAGLKVACYYGCLAVRPRRATRVDDSENPQELDRLLKVIGIESVDWSHKSECCGAGFTASAPEVVAARTDEIIRQALDAGAEAITVACPMCHTNIEMTLHRLGRPEFPVPFFTQLVGLALGFSIRETGLNQLLGNGFPWREKLAPVAETRRQSR